jgi:hypothetical protein
MVDTGATQSDAALAGIFLLYSFSFLFPPPVSGVDGEGESIKIERKEDGRRGAALTRAPWL